MGLILVIVVVALLGSPILFMPGWKSFAGALAVYAGAILWLTWSASQPAGVPCTGSACASGAMVGHVLGTLLQTIAWSVLGLFAIVKAAMLTAPR